MLFPVEEMTTNSTTSRALVERQFSWDKERSRHYSLLLGEGQKCAWCPQLHKGRGERLGKDTVLRPRDLIPETEAYKENAPLPIPHTTKQVSSSNW